MNLYQYIEIIAKRHKAGISSEHSYRADLESLIRELVPGVDITNEPLKVTDCGNPDYVITRRKIPIIHTPCSLAILLWKKSKSNFCGKYQSRCAAFP